MKYGNRGAHVKLSDCTASDILNCLDGVIRNTSHWDELHDWLIKRGLRFNEGEIHEKIDRSATSGSLAEERSEMLARHTDFMQWALPRVLNTSANSSVTLRPTPPQIPRITRRFLRDLADIYEAGYKDTDAYKHITRVGNSGSHVEDWDYEHFIGNPAGDVSNPWTLLENLRVLYDADPEKFENFARATSLIPPGMKLP